MSSDIFPIVIAHYKKQETPHNLHSTKFIMPTTVFVSGANGFIAAHVVQQLIDGGYSVVGSVRTKDKADLLKRRIPNNLEVEVVPSFTEEGAFDEALKKHPEVSVFLHTASPVIFNAQDRERDVILPAIHGTVNALKAAHKYDIKHFVYTSSTAALYNPNDSNKADLILTEELWNNETREEAVSSDVLAYLGSKVFAEKSAWEFVEKEKPGFSFNVINPVFVFGPQAFDEDAKGTLNFSAGIIGLVLSLGPNDPIPTYKGGAIDVRDVAKAHILAFERSETYGKRLVLKEAFYTSQLVLDIIRKNYPQLAAKLPIGETGSSSEVEKHSVKVDNTVTRELLRFEFISLEKQITDTVDQILKYNEVTPAV